ncbi:MAG: MFS transporter [Gemmataceae bacterium]
MLLLLINLFNYIDRQVLAAVEPEVARTFFPKVVDPASGEEVDPPNSGFYMGLLSTAFLVTYMLTSPVFGALSTWMSRWLLIGVGVAVWSLASGASGLATTYAVMLLTRCFVGIGEAVYGPVAPDVLSDLYPVKRRGQILAYFYAAIPFGGALGYALGDMVVRVHRGLARGVLPRRAAGPPVDPLVLPDGGRPRPGRRGQAAARKQSPSDYLYLLRISRPTPANCAGMTAMTFAMGGMAFVAAFHLEYRGVEESCSASGRRPPSAGSRRRLSGLVATLVGGWAKRRPARPLLARTSSSPGRRWSSPSRCCCCSSALAVPAVQLATDGVRLLPVLQHRADEHDPGQRHPPAAPR